MPSELDQIRDELARELGWFFSTDPQQGPIGWQGPDGNFYDVTHPVGSDLDSIAACMPAGWTWEKRAMIEKGKWSFRWFAYPESENGLEATVEYTGDEKLDRAKLALAAIRAGKERR